MGKRTKALVKPDILVWARESAGFDVETAARKLGTKPARLLAWEDANTDDRPTIVQLRKMAGVYKRPLGVFYLQERPDAFQVLHDYRRLPGTGKPSYSPELVLEQRLVSQRREQALELAAEIQTEPKAFRHRARLEEDPEAVGGRIRRILQVSPEEQFAWPDERTAFNSWRRKIEDVDIMVFQMMRVPSNEVSGFAISHQIFPVIAVNRRRTPHTRRIFSLFHEFAHLMLRRSGVSEFDVDAKRLPEDQRIEVWCNAVAAAVLMPREQFLTDDIVRAHSGQDWLDNDIRSIGKRYCVSREAVVRRLLTLNKTSQAFYKRKRGQYLREWKERLEREKIANRTQQFSHNPSQDALSELGKPFIRLVLNTFYEDRITFSDVLSYLNVRARHIPVIEQRMEAF